MPQNETHCKACGKIVSQLPTGRRRLHCDTKCKQRALRARQKAQSPVIEVVGNESLGNNLIDLESAPVEALQAEASIRGLSMDGDRKTLSLRILRHDGIGGDASAKVVAYQPKPTAPCARPAAFRIQRPAIRRTAW